MKTRSFSCCQPRLGWKGLVKDLVFTKWRLRKHNIRNEWTLAQIYLWLPHFCQNYHLFTKNKIFYTIMHTTVRCNGDLVRRESSILRKRHSCWHGRKHGLRTPRESFFSKIPNFWAWADKFGRKFLGHFGYFRLIYQSPFWDFGTKT